MGSIAIQGTDARQKISQLVDRIRVGQLVTSDTDGMLHARPMVAQAKNLDGQFWFVTDISSRKVAQIRQNGHALLSYASPEQQDYVSISGSAPIVTRGDRIREIWTKDAELWFPRGPGDPRIALIRFEAEYAEYWDSTSNALLFAYEYIKARLTQHPPTEMGEMGHVHYNNL